MWGKSLSMTMGSQLYLFCIPWHDTTMVHHGMVNRVAVSVPTQGASCGRRDCKFLLKQFHDEQMAWSWQAFPISDDAFFQETRSKKYLSICMFHGACSKKHALRNLLQETCFGEYGARYIMQQPCFRKRVSKHAVCISIYDKADTHWIFQLMHQKACMELAATILCMRSCDLSWATCKAPGYRGGSRGERAFYYHTL